MSFEYIIVISYFVLSLAVYQILYRCFFQNFLLLLSRNYVFRLHFLCFLLTLLRALSFTISLHIYLFFSLSYSFLSLFLFLFESLFLTYQKHTSLSISNFPLLPSPVINHSKSFPDSKVSEALSWLRSRRVSMKTPFRLFGGFIGSWPVPCLVAFCIILSFSGMTKFWALIQDS